MFIVSCRLSWSMAGGKRVYRNVDDKGMSELERERVVVKRGRLVNTVCS